MAEQLALLGVVKRERQPVSDEVVRMQPSLLAAINLAIQVSGLELKQIYSPLGIDKSTFSKILDGQFAFPPNKYEEFMDLVGNEIPLIWLANKRGYALVPLRDAKDRRIAELEQQNAELRKEFEILKKHGFLGAK